MGAHATLLQHMQTAEGATMTTTPTTAGPAPLSRGTVSALFGQTMGLVALTAGIFAVGAYIGRDSSGVTGIVCFLLAFGVLLGMNAAVQRSEQLAIGLLFAFGILMGLAVAPSISYYLDADPRGVWLSGAATALFVAGFGAAGYVTRRDLSALARSLFWALIGLIVFGIVLVFVELPNGALVYAVAGLVIFAGLTAYDFQRLRRNEDIRTAPLLAVSIFLDVLNVFLLFLSLFSRGE
jgi:modulator of FtsH protease